MARTCFYQFTDKKGKKKKKNPKEKKLAEDSIIWSWIWHCFQQWLCIAAVTAPKLSPWLSGSSYFIGRKKLLLKMEKDPVVKMLFKLFLTFWNDEGDSVRACSCTYGMSDGKEQTMEVSLFLNSLSVKNTIFLLSSSIFSLFLKSSILQ